MPNLCNSIKILGVYFGYDAKQRDELNFRNTLKSLKKTINLWKWRGLSLLGPSLCLERRCCQFLKTLSKRPTRFFTILFGMGKIK